MPILSTERIAELLEVYFPFPPERLLSQLSVYLDLLVKWNARTNLTTIVAPDDIVRRHFGESLFLARMLPPCQTLLDLGSGAGFPGLPTQLACPEIVITLAESQNKKAAFLREAVRSLGLSTRVWASRAEAFSDEDQFDVVALRAVDNPEVALALARRLVRPGGLVAHLTSEAAPSSAQESSWIPIPGTTRGHLRLIR